MSHSGNIKAPRHRWRNTRRVVQGAVFLLFLSPLIISGWSLFGLTVGGDEPLPVPTDTFFSGSLSSSQLGPIELIDPFVTLQVIAASKSFDVMWLVYALPLLLLFGVLGARVFCGWACPVNLFLEGVDFIREKLGIKVKEQAIPRRAKMLVALAVVILSALLSVPFFESFSPISAINKFFLFGSTAGLVTLGLIVVMELFWGHRTWCRSMCPLGGFYQALGRVGLLKVHIDDEVCTRCDSCKKVCIADPEILEPAVDEGAGAVYAGDCMLCGKCIDVCPVKALSVKPTVRVTPVQNAEKTEELSETA
ncbi:MAG: NapH/MauN family ferredoxin-type protein [Raoultibacter sp.]|jgi:ferredoxin-type protein NapH